MKSRFEEKTREYLKVRSIPWVLGWIHSLYNDYEIDEYEENYLYAIADPEGRFNSLWDTNDATDKALYNFANRALEAPTIDLERKIGKWIVYYECSKCGEITKDFTEYCPFCGANMREGME